MRLTQKKKLIHFPLIAAIKSLDGGIKAFHFCKQHWTSFVQFIMISKGLCLSGLLRLPKQSCKSSREFLFQTSSPQRRIETSISPFVELFVQKKYYWVSCFKRTSENKSDLFFCSWKIHRALSNALNSIHWTPQKHEWTFKTAEPCWKERQCKKILVKLTFIGYNEVNEKQRHGQRKPRGKLWQWKKIKDCKKIHSLFDPSLA